MHPRTLLHGKRPARPVGRVRGLRLTLLATVAALATTAVALTLSTPAQALIVTGHTGSGAPALTRTSTRLYVAWTGTAYTAAAKELDLGYSTSNGKNIVKISTSERTPQNEGAALDTEGDGIIMVWPAGNNGNTLTAVYYDGTSTFSCRTTFTGIVSPHSPAIGNDHNGRRWLAWTDTTGHLNVAPFFYDTCATSHVMTLGTRTTLTATSPYGPGMVWDDSGSSNLGLLLAYIANDAAHTLVTGTFQGSATLANIANATIAGGSVYPSSQPAIGSADSDLYLTLRGSDNYRYAAYSEGCRPTCFNLTQTSDQVTSPIGAETGYFTDWAYFNAAGNLTFDSYFH
jgi:hypothetical protein